MTPEDVTATAVATEIARGITDAVNVNARILARQRGEEAVNAALNAATKADLTRISRESVTVMMQAAAPVIAAGVRQRLKQLLLGCTKCGHVHNPMPWTRLSGPVAYGHPWCPRYLAPGNSDYNSHVARLLDTP